MFVVYLFIFFIGLCLGSFTNVLIWRIPKGLSIKGRSVCRKCKSKISWYDNVPLLSYILLKGRCRKCKSRISLSYPLVELLSGTILVLLFLKSGLSYEMILFTILSPILISIFFIDLKHQIIPDELVFWGIGFSFLYSLFIFPQFIYSSIFAGFISSSTLLFLYIITKSKGMGLGDVKFAILGGMIAGFTNIFHWLFWAFLTGAFVGVILILGKKYSLKSKIAFGPFMIFALYLIIFFKI